MKKLSNVLVILADHDSRVRLRSLCEEKFGVTVYSAANPLDGLSLLLTLGPPDFILLSSQAMPLMSFEEFLRVKARTPAWAPVPVVLTSVEPVTKIPEGVLEEVGAPITESTLQELVLRYCSQK